MPKLQYFLPSGLTTKRNHKNPKLVPTPFLENVALKGPIFFDFLKRQAIILFQILKCHY
jgi:hypothetical protein